MSMCTSNRFSSIGSFHSQSQDSCYIDKNKEEKASEQCLQSSRVDDMDYIYRIKICNHLLDVH
jgi:hypothetical protein